jgi:gliding motility-associated-like protein
MTYVDATANANTTAYQYKVSTVSGCYDAEAMPTDPISPMRLSMNAPTDQVAPLSWTTLNPKPATTDPSYQVQRSTNGGTTWNTVANTPNTTYNDTVYICNGNVRYRIALRDSSGCISHSTIQSNNFKDILPPDSVNTVAVSVDTLNNNVVINWTQNTSPDVIGYVVYTTQNPTAPNPIYTPVDTIFALGTYTYPDRYHRTDTAIIYYNIAAFDSCTNISAPVKPEIHNNIWLRADVDPCNSTINITWNAYNNWVGGVRQYEIYRSEPGTADALLAVQSGLTYADNTVISQKTYCYTIIAKSNDVPSIVSFSNKLCVKADVVQKSDAYIRYATVVPNTEQIRLAFVADTTADVLRYELERSISNNSSFEKIADILPNAFVSTRPAPLGRTFGDFYYNDNDVRTARSNYYYRIKSVDACGGQDDLSNFARSILLKGSAEGNFTDSLWWNPYPNLGFEAGLGGYDIYRQIPSVGSLFLRIGTSGLNSTYVDNIVTTVDDNGKFCYYVEALEFAPNVFGLLDTARSNVVCVTQPPRLYVPNAFVPNGVNNIFNPKGVFVDKTQGYSFKIFNRWGEEIFATTDYNKGWDGKMTSGEEAAKSIYVYVIKFVGKDGNVYDTKGTVTLIR